jgi:hypothetical protein
MDHLLDGQLSRPEDILLYWLRNDVRPVVGVPSEELAARLERRAIDALLGASDLRSCRANAGRAAALCGKPHGAAHHRRLRRLVRTASL